MCDQVVEEGGYPAVQIVGNGTIAQQPALIGQNAVENAVKLINGKGIAPSIPVEVTLITAANAGR